MFPIQCRKHGALRPQKPLRRIRNGLFNVTMKSFSQPYCVLKYNKLQQLFPGLYFLHVTLTVINYLFAS